MQTRRDGVVAFLLSVALHAAVFAFASSAHFGIAIRPKPPKPQEIVFVEFVPPPAANSVPEPIHQAAAGPQRLAKADIHVGPQTAPFRLATGFRVIILTEWIAFPALRH